MPSDLSFATPCFLHCRGAPLFYLSTFQFHFLLFSLKSQERTLAVCSCKEFCRKMADAAAATASLCTLPNISVPGDLQKPGLSSRTLPDDYGEALHPQTGELHPEHIPGNGPDQDYLSRFFAHTLWRSLGADPPCASCTGACPSLVAPQT